MADAEVELLATALRRDSADLDLYGAVLTEIPSDALPPGAVRVMLRRSLGQRPAGRPGTVAEVGVLLGDLRFSLSTHDGRTAAEIRHEVRGVVLSRRPVGLDEWLAALADALSEAAASNVRARTAVERFLT
ncbi:hypothetical protein ACFXA3_33080 [Streptomyces sp. NPDC059456]|uniref:hypothetical protein n=1 Tax=Streptomyces sp. NPDC059456 TaxID=3346838 RepID=UPI0036A031E5